MRTKGHEEDGVATANRVGERLGEGGRVLDGECIIGNIVELSQSAMEGETRVIMTPR